MLRAVAWLKLCRLLAPALLAGAAAAQPADQPVSAAALAASFPAGSIKTRDEAQRALTAADSVGQAAERIYQSEQQRCERVFFVTRCKDSARRTHLLARREAQRVQVEAHDLLRHLDSEERAKLKAEREQAQPTPAERAQSEAQAKTSYDERKAEQQREEERRQQRAAEGKEYRAEYERRQAERKKAEEKRAAEAPAEAARRAQAAKAFELRQRQAAENAKKKEQERLENEKRRAKRREEQEAAAAK